MIQYGKIHNIWNFEHFFPHTMETGCYKGSADEGILSSNLEAVPLLPLVEMALLLIGSTGNGKSTLGNFLLMDPSDSHTKKPKFRMARANKPETQEVTYEEFQHTDDRTYRVIDTPGLNESPVKDMIHMCSLVKALNDPNLQGVTACLLCVKFNSKIDAQYKDTVGYYSRLLPSLFDGNVLVIMTEYLTDPRSEKLRKAQEIDVKSVKKNAADEIRESANLSYTPPVFTIDCLPLDEEERSTSLEVREDIMKHIEKLTPVSTTNLQVVKTTYLRELDSRKIEGMWGEIRGYNERLMEVNTKATETLIELEDTEREIIELSGKIVNIEFNLKALDSSELVVANTWRVSKHSKIGKTPRKDFKIESQWKIKKINEWTNSHTELVIASKTDYEVTGSCRGHKMRKLHATIILETERKEKYATMIASMRTESDQLHEELECKEKEIEQFRKNHSQYEKEIGLLRNHIKERKKEIETLSLNTMSINEAMKRVEEIRLVSRGVNLELVTLPNKERRSSQPPEQLDKGMSLKVVTAPKEILETQPFQKDSTGGSPE